LRLFGREINHHHEEPMSTHQLSPVARAAEAATQSELDRLLQRPFTPRDLLEEQNFDKIWRMAEALANSALSIPKELKGNIGDCLAIVTQAMIWGLNPFAVAQKAHVINGKLGYEAQLVNAVVMQSGAIVGSFHYEHQGDSCRVGAVLRGEQHITWGEWLSAATVTTKNSPLWKTNPKQQMGYLQVKNWARAYCPGALLGIYSDDELYGIDMTTGEIRSAPSSAASTDGRPDLQAYEQAAFDKNLPAWTKLVADGKKTPSDLLAMLSTKATFTEQQKAQILSLKKAAPPPADPPPPDAGATVGNEEEAPF
jgi:hypothetical protein